MEYILAAIVVLVVIVLLVAKGRKAPEPAAPKKREAKTATAAKPTPVEQKPSDQPESQQPSTEQVSEEPAKPEPEPESEPEPEPRKSDIPGLRRGLARSRDDAGFFGRLKALFAGKSEISSELVEEMEEVLLTSDVGATATTSILESVRAGLDKGDLSNEAAVWNALRNEALSLLNRGDHKPGLRLKHKPTVVLMVGVNGAGKTTTIGKLATKLQAQGKTCVLAAGDTFRAAAVQQLVVWGQRVGCEVVKGKDGADPGSVVFDAVKRAQELGADVVLADTAGRLHTKSNLMSEMQKIERTLGKAMDGAPHETLLVIDATNGQNAIAQAKEFKDTLNLTGIVLTKLDGTAKGGFVLGITSTLSLPVRFVGLGERPDDLHEFVAEDFVEALLGKDG